MTEKDHQLRCDTADHGPTCEGRDLHIRRRDRNGCAQFQDGSWITKAWYVCRDEHPRGDAPEFGQGDALLFLIEKSRR